MRIIPALIFFCCCIPAIHAQEFRGIVSDTESGELLRGARIENKSRQRFAVTDDHGAFSLYAFPGDTLQFSLIGYLSRSMVLHGTGVTLFRRIALSKDLIPIDTVVITPGLTPYQRDSLERRNIYGKKVDEKPAKFGRNKRHPLYGRYGEGKMTFNAPVSSFFQKRSKKYKRLKAFQDHFKADENQRYIDSRYNEETVTELTGLRGEALTAFIDAYPIAYDFARTATDLEIKMWIRYNYKIWSGKRQGKKK